MISLAALEIIAAGISIGLLLGLTGGGGSILTVPLLVYVIGLEPKVAIATSMLIVGVTSLAALLSHSHAGRVAWRTGAIFGLAGMAGAYCGGVMAQLVAGGVLLLLFAGVMVCSGLSMLRRTCATAIAPMTTGDAPALSTTRILTDGLGVGILTGLLGAGGGFLVVPALALRAGLAMHTAIGTSLLVIAMNCAAGIASYALTSGIVLDVDAGAVISALSVVGTILGARLARAISPARLQRGFGLFVLLVAVILFCLEGSGLLAPVLALDRFIVGATLFVLSTVALMVLVIRILHNNHVAYPPP